MRVVEGRGGADDREPLAAHDALRSPKTALTAKCVTAEWSDGVLEHILADRTAQWVDVRIVWVGRLMRGAGGVGPFAYDKFNYGTS